MKISDLKIDDTIRYDGKIGHVINTIDDEDVKKQIEVLQKKLRIRVFAIMDIVTI